MLYRQHEDIREGNTILISELRILLQVLPDAFDSLRGEQDWRTRPSQQLTKSGQVDSLEDTTLERPCATIILNIGFPAGYRRNDILELLAKKINTR